MTQTGQLLLATSRPLGNPGRMQPTYVDPQGFLYLTCSGKASDDPDGKKVRQALFTPKRNSINDNRKK